MENMVRREVNSRCKDREMEQCYEIGRSKETKRNELILGLMSMLMEVLTKLEL
jgi:hypothetical protein